MKDSKNTTDTKHTMRGNPPRQSHTSIMRKKLIICLLANIDTEIKNAGRSKNTWGIITDIFNEQTANPLRNFCKFRKLGKRSLRNQLKLIFGHNTKGILDIWIMGIFQRSLQQYSTHSHGIRNLICR